MSAPERAVRAVTRRWDRRAVRYAEHYARLGADYRDQWREVYRRVVADLLATHDPVDVLDVGTGSGFAAVLLAELGHRVQAVDAAPAMLRQAESTAREHGVTVRFAEADAHQVAALGRFDLVTCRYVLWTLPSPQAALANWHTALRPGGAVLVCDGMWHHGRAGRSSRPRGPWRAGAELVAALRDRISMRSHLPYWDGLTAQAATDLLTGAGFAAPVSYHGLLDKRVPRDSHDLFIVGARRGGQREEYA